MKKILNCIFLMLLFYKANAQEYRRNENWTLGFGPIVRFNFNSAMVVDTFQTMNAAYSTSCISDTLGKFLFYMNGFGVLNKTGLYVQDGMYLNCPYGTVWINYTGGSTSWDQNSIIIPKKIFSIMYSVRV